MYKRNDLTVEQVRAEFHYDPATGLFVRLVARYHSPAGRIVGTLDKIHGQILISINGVLYKAHRLAWLYMTGEWPPEEIDHISRDSTDNRWSNLRLATHSQNTINRTSFERKSPYPRGVQKHGIKFRARTKINGRDVLIGVFKTPEEAEAAYKTFMSKTFGDFLPQEATNA